MSQSTLHEKVLLEGLKEGNVKIFDYLFLYYYSGLVAFSFQIVEDKHVAEDIVQDFFFQLWMGRNKIEIRQSLKSYFFSAVKNKSLDFLKRKKIGAKIEDEIAYLRHGALEEKNFLAQSELESVVNDALEKLPEKCRKIFTMNRFDGIKPAEIAEMENISLRTVEGHIGKAIKILRAELQPYLPAFLIMLITKGM